MKAFGIALMAGLMGFACGGSGTSEPEPKCEKNADCPQNTTPYCVEGVCLQAPNIPTCDTWEDCEAGFHCEDDQCMPKCEAGRDCCPNTQDCAGCDNNAECNEVKCLSDGSCLMTTPVDDCTPCTDMGWDCLGTAPECFLAGLCNLPEDCADGQICVSDHCTACTADEQCPLDQVCQNGACAETSSPDPPDDANRLCSRDTDCTHIQDGYCSEDIDPRRCTKACANHGQCRSEGFDSCNSNGECEGSSA